MKSSKEISELEKLSADLAPKTGCRICKVILIATLLLFISSVLLAVFAMKKSRETTEIVNPPRVLTAEQTSERMRVLRAYIESQRGSSTIIIDKSHSK